MIIGRERLSVSLCASLARNINSFVGRERREEDDERDERVNDGSFHGGLVR
jgi:hypothetical protein